MKLKTSELIGHALDWAVAKCEQEHDERLTVIRREDQIGHPIERETEKGSYTYEWWCPTRIWSQGGPIIEREKLCVDIGSAGVWLSWSKQNYADEPLHMVSGPTPLIAAMRCYCCSKLGDVVDIPEELCQQQNS